MLSVLSLTWCIWVSLAGSVDCMVKESEGM